MTFRVYVLLTSLAQRACSFRIRFRGKLQKLWRFVSRFIYLRLRISFLLQYKTLHCCARSSTLACKQSEFRVYLILSKMGAGPGCLKGGGRKEEEEAAETAGKGKRQLCFGWSKRLGPFRLLFFILCLSAFPALPHKVVLPGVSSGLAEYLKESEA